MIVFQSFLKRAGKNDDFEASKCCNFFRTFPRNYWGWFSNWCLLDALSQSSGGRPDWILGCRDSINLKTHMSLMVQMVHGIFSKNMVSEDHYRTFWARFRSPGKSRNHFCTISLAECRTYTRVRWNIIKCWHHLHAWSPDEWRSRSLILVLSAYGWTQKLLKIDFIRLIMNQSCNIIRYGVHRNFWGRFYKGYSVALLRATLAKPIKSNPNLKEEKARQKCDIYSFSIISHEVIFEQGPYWTGPYSSDKDPIKIERLLEKLRLGIKDIRGRQTRQEWI